MYHYNIKIFLFISGQDVDESNAERRQEIVGLKIVAQLFTPKRECPTHSMHSSSP